ncbi:hypothetical protein EYS14_03560 [Alteromonadaceae bacterium M269]|nr:hypothetical protein EYS14_03560 [Alteromonadaceae bacterium M269]
MQLNLDQLHESDLQKLEALIGDKEFIAHPVTVSRIQRHLRIGYNRACHLIENARAKGILIQDKDNPLLNHFSTTK